MKVKKLAHLIAMIGVAGSAAAQNAAPQQPIARVEITGSSIKRIATEGAMPVQVITFDQIEKMGLTSADDLVRSLSANGVGADNVTSGNNVFGPDADRVSGGASFASLRGLGPNSTLVLVNGRRVSTHGSSGKAVDLNSIPTAAIQRVEILKDGASAIYGTDAVGGVINFILRSDFRGAQVSVNQNHSENGGGATRRASLLVGAGNLEEDRFNVMASVTVDHNDKLTGSQRLFNNGFQPERGLSPDTTGTPYANVLSGAGTALGTGFKVPGSTNNYLQANPLSFQGKCDSVAGMSQYQVDLWRNITSPLRSTYSCAYDYGADYMMIAPLERTNVLARGTVKLAADHKMFVEVMGSRNDVISELTSAQISTSLGNKNAYPVGGPYYLDLTPWVPTYDKTKPIIYKWRANDLGKRTQRRVTDNMRVLVGFEGSFNNWDYKAGVSRSRSETDMSLIDGYAYTDQLYAALATGKINPWLAPGQTQTAEAKQLLESTKFRGGLHRGTTTLTQVDGSVSGEVMNLPAGPLSVAVGIDLRRESYGFTEYTDATKILLAPGNASLGESTRDIKAVYTEFLVPVTKQLELQLALRRDDYSLVGATTNPKVAFSYRPTNWLLFRGSAGKGFLAPSFTQLYTGSLDQELSSGADDPVNCPTHPGDPRYCAVRLDYKSGGNPKLRPETSKQGTLGVVVEPYAGYTVSLDWWAINSKDRILNRSPLIVLQNYQALSDYIVRNPDGTINYIQAGWINAAGSKIRGADLTANGGGKIGEYKWGFDLNGTYVYSFKFQEFASQPYQEYVGKFFTRDLQLRWKHDLRLSLARGDWSALLTQRYSSGYMDQVPNGGKTTPPPGFNPEVSDYVTYDASVTYKGFKNTSITFGIQNLVDRDPPFTAHNVDDVVGAGWDPRVASPRGRSFWLNLKYDFK